MCTIFNQKERVCQTAKIIKNSCFSNFRNHANKICFTLIETRVVSRPSSNYLAKAKVELEQADCSQGFWSYKFPSAGDGCMQGGEMSSADSWNSQVALMLQSFCFVYYCKQRGELVCVGRFPLLFVSFRGRFLCFVLLSVHAALWSLVSILQVGSQRARMSPQSWSI